MDDQLRLYSILVGTDILVQRLLVMQYLVDFQGHCLTRPHVRDLTEPAICKFDYQQTSFVNLWSPDLIPQTRRVVSLELLGGRLRDWVRLTNP